VGGLISNVSGILFGGTLESVAKSAGLPSSNLTAAQRSLPFVKRNRLFAQAFGVLLGCTIGLVNLLFIDVERSSTLKLQQQSERHEFAYEIEAINNTETTTFILRGPDNDGLLADITAALTTKGCSILDVTAHQLEDGSIKDTFIVVDKQTKSKLEDDELEEVSKLLLTSVGGSPHLLRAQLEEQNKTLQARVAQLENELFKRRLTIRRAKTN
jgi:lambda repressor-like predicted transcriptional regulator